MTIKQSYICTCVCTGDCALESSCPWGCRRECQTCEAFYMGARMELVSSAIAVYPLNHETISPDLVLFFILFQVITFYAQYQELSPGNCTCQASILPLSHRLRQKYKTFKTKPTSSNLSPQPGPAHSSLGSSPITVVLIPSRGNFSLQQRPLKKPQQTKMQTCGLKSQMIYLQYNSPT